MQRFFIAAKIADNPHLDQDAYRASLSHLPEGMRKRLEDGDWGVFEGAAFPMFDETVHVVDYGEGLPDWWERFEALDYRSQNPTAWYLFGVDQYGNVLVADEYYSPGQVREHADEVSA